jgi:hypothetical protein
MMTLCMFINGSVLAAVNGLKLRAPHLTTGIVMLKATYIYVRIIVECIYFARIYSIYSLMMLVLYGVLEERCEGKSGNKTLCH